MLGAGFCEEMPIYLCVHGYRSQESTLGVEPYFMYLPYFWRQGLLLAWKLPVRLLSPRDPPVSTSPALGIHAHTATPGFLCEFGVLNSGWHACSANTLPTELYLSPSFRVFWIVSLRSCINT